MHECKMANSLKDQERKHYFVDEAGDANLFSSKGQVIIGNPGCSRFFILGVLDVQEPDNLHRELQTLRKDLLADPYFKDVPSMQPEARKSAVSFHAKDDVPEVRREVFRVLKDRPMSFMAVVKEKVKVLEYVRGRNQQDPNYRYHPNELYDLLVRRLFKTLQHKADVIDVYFSKRGKADRTKALQNALKAGRMRFEEQYGTSYQSRVHIHPSESNKLGCLQAADYFLWSLQRLYERLEDRYVRYLWQSFGVVIDIDDTREKEYGAYYSQERPLTIEDIKNRKPGI